MAKVLEVPVSSPEPKRSFGHLPKGGWFEPQLARVRLNDDDTVSLMVYGPRPPYRPPILLNLDMRSWRQLMGRLDQLVGYTT